MYLVLVFDWCIEKHTCKVLGELSGMIGSSWQLWGETHDLIAFVGESYMVICPNISQTLDA